MNRETPPNATTVIVGVSGSIAAFRAADLVSQLTQSGYVVHVMMTRAATRLVSTDTFRALSRHPVLVDVFTEPESGLIAHIDLARAADVMIVAPASADIIARLAAGLADDMLTTCALALRPEVPLLVAPAMNTAMYEHPATSANLAVLARRGVRIVEPDTGSLACGEIGAGRLASVAALVAAVDGAVSGTRDLAGLAALVTAGSTREPVDPVRVITNRSSGRMGYAVAAELQRRGARVTLIAGAATVPAPPRCTLIHVSSAEQMLAAARDPFTTADIVVAAAAVADYRPAAAASHKIKKSSEPITLELIQTVDVLRELTANRRRDQVIVAFAAETENALPNAEAKLRAKRADLVVLNDVSRADIGFDSEDNEVTLITEASAPQFIGKRPKAQVAKAIVDAVVDLRARPLPTA